MSIYTHHRITRRLNHELVNIDYDITETDEDNRPLHIICYYKGVDLHVNLGPNYPFRCPPSISDITNSWSHTNYELYRPLLSTYKPSLTCLHCSTMCVDNWAPGTKLVQLFERFRRCDQLIATCLKLDLIFFRNRQIVELPEDVIYYVIFQFLDIDLEPKASHAERIVFDLPNITLAAEK